MAVTGLRDFHVCVFAVLIILLPQVYIQFEFSNGWLSIRCHSFIRICFKLGTDQVDIYVRKGKIRLFSLFFVIVGGLVFCFQISLQKVFSVSNFLGNLSQGGVV